MTTEQARKIFDAAADAHRANGDRDQAARVEIIREYFTNPTFRAKLADYVAQLNGL